MQQLAQQRAVGQVLDARRRAAALLEAHGVADLGAEAAAPLLGDAPRDGDGALFIVLV